MPLNDYKIYMKRVCFCVFSVLIAGLLFFHPAARGGLIDKYFGSDKKLVLVYVDLSGSISKQDWGIYKESFQKLIEKLEPGDKLVLGRISDQSMATFKPDAERELPKSGVAFNDKEEGDKVKGVLVKDFETLQSQPQTTLTNILDVLNISQDYFQKNPERKIHWVVILSDMVEESKDVNFKKKRLTPELVEKIISSKKKQNALPSLPGAKIFVAGAGEVKGNSSKYHEIRDFWLRYFKETGAVCEPSMYGRTAIVEYK